MLDEYDFRGGVRGKYSARFAEGTKLVVLDADGAELFPNSMAVNEALRLMGNSPGAGERANTRGGC